MQAEDRAGIAGRRLRAQRLVGEPFATAVDAVRWLGAVQSQDYAGARWALGQRTRDATVGEIDRLVDEGAILRTHVMRPTWHLVAADDIGWLLTLTGSRVRLGIAGRYRRLEIDDATAARAGAAFRRALAGGRHATRAELGEVLRRAGIAPDGQRLPHLLMRAELEGIIVSGPGRGRELTHALLEERTPRGMRALSRDEAIAELTLRYFRSHGPAQVQDFVWWSGLTTADARAGIASVGRALDHQVIDGADHWFDAGALPDHRAPDVAHLLPNFDEYTVGYRDRAAALDPQRPFTPELFSYGSVLSNIVTIRGQVRGAWRRASARGGSRVEIRLLDRLRPSESRAVDDACGRLGRFLGHPVSAEYSVTTRRSAIPAPDGRP